MKLFFLLIFYFPIATRYLLFAICYLLVSCSIQKKISKTAETILSSSALKAAHTGISVFDPATGKYWFNYQADKYFIPASNTKLPTCYVAMKYLKDDLVGLRYRETNDAVYIFPTGDPTFLHPDFKLQPVFDFLKNSGKKIILNISQWNDKGWGSGWSWNDYSEVYMAERSIMPIYGNIVRFSNQLKSLKVIPEFFSDCVSRDSSMDENLFPSSVHRELAANHFFIEGRSEKENSVEAPFYTDDGEIIYKLLPDTLHKQIFRSAMIEERNSDSLIHSQPTDSLLKVTMHRSDNFFAEQVLLMVSGEKLGIMNDQEIIDAIIKTDFKDLPQKPRWVDGSGLSRYNLFTPQDFITILSMMKNEFGMERMKEILPTGGEGTLASYYKADSNFIFAKTGTLSGVVALSGYLYTKKNKLLIFSVLVNNHQASATVVRKEVEKFLQEIRNR